MRLWRFIKRIFGKKNKSKLLFNDLQELAPHHIDKMMDKYGDENFFDIRKSINRYQSPDKSNQP